MNKSQLEREINRLEILACDMLLNKEYQSAKKNHKRIEQLKGELKKYA